MSFLNALSQAFPTLHLLEEEPLSRHTSFRIGGPCTMALPATPQELVELYRFCLRQGRRPLLLGAGTNILAPDAGVEQLVICTRALNTMEVSDTGVLEAQCGASLARVACLARDAGWSGLEFAHGIPGTVGGGIYMNAGAYGGEMAQVAVQTTAMLPDGSIWQAEGEQQGFSYRTSAFQKRQAVVLSTRFQLKRGDTQSIGARMQELAEKRRVSQPLEQPSAGSTFKRPEGAFAAALIEQAGLKGKGVGQAAVSQKHAGFVVNLGGATAADVLATMELIQKTVYASSGICLEPEVRIWKR